MFQPSIWAFSVVGLPSCELTGIALVLKRQASGSRREEGIPSASSRLESNPLERITPAILGQVGDDKARIITFG
jgi:hypothetical protein